jgi:putative resolvase
VVRTVASEIGSARNGHRPRLLKILADQAVTTIIVEHRERLVRFGFEYVEAALAATGRSIVVLEPVEIADDLVRDMTEVLTSFCARLYGRRSAARRAREAVRAIQEQQEQEAL